MVFLKQPINYLDDQKQMSVIPIASIFSVIPISSNLLLLPNTNKSTHNPQSSMSSFYKSLPVTPLLLFFFSPSKLPNIPKLTAFSQFPISLELISLWT